jgi:predicted phosphoribosyltransferase
VKFADLQSGGRAVAAELEHYRHAENAIVLGIIRGGVAVAFEVARAFELPLDLVLLRRMMERLPGPPVCAARVAGALVLLDDELTAMTGHPPKTVEEIFVADALEELKHREQVCRGSRPAVHIAGKTVLLVDNGMRTGGTMRLAINAVRRLAPARIVAAVPAGSAEAVALVTPLADEMICLWSPQPFGHVGMCYKRFDVGNEQQIVEFLDASHVRSHRSMCG